MRTTFVALLGLCAASLVLACDDDKKPTDTAPSATVTASAAAAATTAAPPAKPVLSEVIPKTIKTGVDAWNAHDAAKVAAGFEPTGRLHIPGMPDVTGKDGLMAEARMDFTAYSDFKVAVTRGFIKGNTAVFEWVITGKNDGPMMGKPASGRSMGVAGVSLATFDDDGLMKEEHRYVDFPTIVSQLDPKAKAGTFRAPMTLPTGATEWHTAKGTPDEAKTVAQGDAIIKADASKDDKALMATVTDDYVWQDNSSPTPITPANLKTAQSAYNTAFPDWTMTPTMTMGVDGYYVLETVFSGTQKGPMGPVKASNKPVKTSMVDIQLLKDGKATKEWSYMNSADVLVQIGAMPPMAAPAPAAASGAPPATPAPTAKPK